MRVRVIVEEARMGWQKWILTTIEGDRVGRVNDRVQNWTFWATKSGDG